MPQTGSSIGVVGLAVMGQNLVLNLLDQQFQVSVFNRSYTRTQEMLERYGAHYKERLSGFGQLADFVQSLASPRKILLMVQAGPSIDEMIALLLPYLQAGDILIDGGNSFYKDSERRALFLETHALHFVGCGISGGEEGARKGPSMMLGGSLYAKENLLELLEGISARDWNSGPCCYWLGPAGTGHFVKMVHNGIEYADMQLISEIYDFARRGLEAETKELQELFERWQKGDLQSYLIEITAKILEHKDQDGTLLLDKILDEAGQKGTGRWTVEEALERKAPLTLIAEAVFARQISGARGLRSAMRQGYPQKRLGKRIKGKEQESPLALCSRDLEEALFAAKLISYAQGFLLLAQTSQERNWSLPLGEIARIWSGGCIIRSRFLKEIFEAYSENPPLDLLLAPVFLPKMENGLEALRRIVLQAVEMAIPVPALSSALAYLDSLRSERLPANLIQAQRDFFGAHTYQRIDAPQERFFHTDWSQTGAAVRSTSYNA